VYRRSKSVVDLDRCFHQRLRKRKVEDVPLKRNVLKLFMQRDEGKKVVESPPVHITAQGGSSPNIGISPCHGGLSASGQGGSSRTVKSDARRETSEVDPACLDRPTQR
jgi:hypothetical protein